MSLDIRRTVKGAPSAPFARIADGILRRRYQLSLVLCGDTLAQRMNAEHRQKTYKPNVLSFPLSETEGEIFLNLAKAGREARAEGITRSERVTYLFIHACLPQRTAARTAHGRTGSRMDEALRLLVVHARLGPAACSATYPRALIRRIQ